MSIVQELKRRNVFRVAAAYVVAAWVIIEVSSLILDIYESPDSVIRIVVALLALGLPFAIFFAWAFEATPEGIKREAEVDRSRSITNQTAKRLDLITITLIVIAVGFYSVDRFRGVNVAPVDDAVSDRVMWATQQLLEIDRLQKNGEISSAYALASEVEPLLAENTIAEDLWDRFSWSTNIESIPSGAQVFRQLMDAPEGEWESLGTTPINNARFPKVATYRLRFELQGHRSVVLLQTAVRQFLWPDSELVKPVRMDPENALPEEMVRISGFTHDLVDYADFFMDRFEVSNREYEYFVAAGGYETPAYWTPNFVRDGLEVQWDEAIGEFLDRTGRPGPATWAGGTYPSGQGDYPVSGVSWYEAVAYANFMDKELLTPAHQDRARLYYGENGGLTASRSNLGGVGPRPVGENRAMTTMGVYDLVGNVTEWIWNEVGTDARGTIGGAWSDAPFHVGWVIPKSSWDRNSTHGIRLIRTFDGEEKLARLREPTKPLSRRDLRNEEPVSDEVFKIYKGLYAYDSMPLNAEIVSVDEFKHWTRERVAFDLPYGERGGALLYIPNNIEPPFEPVIFWGGAGVLIWQSVEEEHTEMFDFLVRDGRVVALPIFNGAYDREDSDIGSTLTSIEAHSTGTKYRDLQIKWVKELSRTIDYLETRDDVEIDKIGYYGMSWGGAEAPIVLAVEERFDAAVLNVGGLIDELEFLPEVDGFNFVHHVRTPTLMLNGEYDTIYPLESSQKPMFDFLGTDPEHKKHYVTAASHFFPRDVLIRESMAWFDRYLSDGEKQDDSTQDGRQQ